VNVPGFTDSSGLPVGVQVVAPFGKDEVALEAASFIEAALRASQ
jgi:Asp-tRNA(Asn)/Glu-tRNA(Gln) amidotransferase A subunit family amidase